jgi:hypothetical protein
MTAIQLAQVASHVNRGWISTGVECLWRLHCNYHSAIKQQVYPNCKYTTCEGGSYLTRYLGNPSCTHYFKAKVCVNDYLYSMDSDMLSWDFRPKNETVVQDKLHTCSHRWLVFTAVNFSLCHICSLTQYTIHTPMFLMMHHHPWSVL